MALSSADAAYLRQPHHTWTGKPLIINAVPLEILATAEINQATFSYPEADLTVDAVSADWLTYNQVGRMVMIGTAPGLADVTYGIIRKASTATTLYLSPLQQGEGGYARDIALDLDDDYYVSICKFHPAWGIGSQIRKGKFYKNWDETYSDGGKNPRPIVRMGEHQQAWVDTSTGLARFTIDLDVYYFAGRSYSTHSYTVDGQTTISSSATQLVVDCEPGCHEIAATFTDNKGKSTTAYRYLFANDPTEYPPLNSQFAINVDMTQDRKGLRATLDFDGDFQGDELYPGQLFVLTETPQWGNPVTGVYVTSDDLSDPDSICDNFVGYALQNTVTARRGTRRTSVTIEAPMVCADHVRIEKQYVEERTNPKNWAQVKPLLSNPVGIFYYLCAHHAPWLLDGHDFYFETYILNLRRKTHDLNKSATLGGQLDQLRARIDGEGGIGSRANGTTYMVRNSQYFVSLTRASQTTHWTWQPGDISGPIEATTRYRPQVGKVYAGAFAHGNGTIEAYRALAPGPVAAGAGGEGQLEDTTVVLTAGQDRVNEIAGFYLAQQNAATTYGEVELNGNLDLTEPCNLDAWHAWAIGAAYDPQGVGWTGKRLLPLAVRRRWAGPGGNRKTLSVEFEAETFGYPGITVPINRGGANNWLLNNTPPPYFDDYRPQVPDLEAGVVMMTAWNNYLNFAKSDNFGDQLTQWTPFASGGIVDATLDWHSDYFSTPTDPLIVLVLTFEEVPGTNHYLTLYSLEFTPNTGIFELTSGPTQIEQWTNITDNDTFYGNARIIVSREETDFWTVAYQDNDGVRIVVSTDGGSSWGLQTSVGDQTAVSGVGSLPLSIDIYQERTCVIAKDGTTNEDGDYIFFVYTASTKGGAFSKIANPTDWEVIPGGLAVRTSSAALVGLKTLDSPTPTEALSEVDFDGGYSQYGVGGGLTGSGVGTSASFPGQSNMGYGYTNEVGANEGVVNVSVTIDLTALYTVTQIDYWTNFNFVSSYTKLRSVHDIFLLDENGDTLKHWSQEYPGTFATGNFTVTDADMLLTGYEQVSQVKVVVTLYYDWSSGTGNELVFLDDLTVSADLIEYDGERAIYSLNPSTSTYTERSSFQKTPTHTHGFAVDVNNASNVSAIVVDENGDNNLLIQSTDGGASWSRQRNVPGFVGLKRGSDIVILFGYNRLELSNDVGLSSYDMRGDWSGRVGPVGLIKGVAGVLA